jgi:ABC-type phosphate transport system substrate-binding protein
MRLRIALLTALVMTVLPQSHIVLAPVASYSGSPPIDQGTLSEPLAIVVNRYNPVDDLSFAELRRVFLGDRSHWTDGRRITIVMREPGDPERKTILRDVCGMNEDQFKTHVLRGLFTSEILVSPKILASPGGVRKFLFNVPGAIGYLRLSDVDSSVKVVRIDKLLPDDKGYRLHIRPEVVNLDE